MKTKKEIMAQYIMNNVDEITNKAKELIKESFISPSFSGWKYRIVVFIDDEEEETCYLDYMLCGNGQFMAEVEGNAICVATINADYGNDIDLGCVEDSLFGDKYEEYKKWYMEKENIKDEEDLDERELNDWDLVKEYDEEYYNNNLECYIDYYTENIIYQVEDKVNDTLEYYLREEEY